MVPQPLYSRGGGARALLQCCDVRGPSHATCETANLRRKEHSMPITMVDLEREFRVKPGRRLRLKRHDPAWLGNKQLRALAGDELKERAKALIQQNLAQLADMQ